MMSLETSFCGWFDGDGRCGSHLLMCGMKDNRSCLKLLNSTCNSLQHWISNNVSLSSKVRSAFATASSPISRNRLSSKMFRFTSLDSCRKGSNTNKDETDSGRLRRKTQTQIRLRYFQWHVEFVGERHEQRRAHVKDDRDSGSDGGGFSDSFRLIEL